MKTKYPVLLIMALWVFIQMGCKKESTGVSHIQIDTLKVTHSMKGWELYSWPEGTAWKYSILIGTNRIKTLDEVKSDPCTTIHLITVEGTDNLKLVLSRFPENEYITWIGQGWLQSCWGGNYANLQLPPQNIIDDLSQFCIQKKLNLQLTE